jgi:hypothetical protein
MKSRLIYVELKDGHSGPAWIGYGQYSKSGRAVYFNGLVLRKGQGGISNHFDIESGEYYWVSGIKKNGQDRHWAGSGKVYLDKSAVGDYLKIIGETELPKNKFLLVDLNNTPNKELSRTITNRKLNDASSDSEE